MLALGWKNGGLQFLGLMPPDESTITQAMSGASTGRGAEAVWMLHRGLGLLLGGEALNLLALGALARAYNLPRELTRLRG